MAVFLNSYYPLCTTKKGRDSAIKYKIAPFLDGSCRREPDFIKDKPAITGLCRTNKLLPRLSKGDLVIYLTNKRKYYNSEPKRFYVGILQVENILSSHKDAMAWYNKNSFHISQNIICENTKPLRSEYTHRFIDKSFKENNGEANIRRWNGFYKGRSIKFPLVAQCKIWKKQMELVNPKHISDEEMYKVFKRERVGTQNPPKLKKEEWERFQNIILTKARIL